MNNATTSRRDPVLDEIWQDCPQTTSQTPSKEPLKQSALECSDVDLEKEVQVRASCPPSDVPPNGGYGWICVACVFLINGHTWGINSSYGVFLAYYISDNSFPGATRLDYAFVGGLSIACAMAVAPLVNIVTRRLGMKTSLLTGVFLEAVSLIAASFTKRIWQLFLSQGVCFGLGMGFLFAASVGVAPQWFTTRRSLANGICASGSGVGGLMYSLAANRMIQTIGLAWALRILGIVALVVNFTCSCLLRNRDTQIGSKQRAFDFSLLRRPEFCLVQGWGIFSMLGYVVLLFSLPNYASSIGLTAHQGSVVGAILNLGQALGRPPIGYFSDAVGRINMAMVATFLAGLFSFVIWTDAHSFGVLIVFALLGGAVAGTYWACIAPVTVEVVGLVDMPSALSIVWVMIVLPTTFSEPIALEIAQKSPIHYLGTQLFAGIMYVAAAICLLLLRAWKIGEVDREERKNEEREEPKSLPEASGGLSSPRHKTFARRMIYWKRV